jgi:hypothetical protein
VLIHADALAGLAYVLLSAGAGSEAREPAACAGELYEAKGDVDSAARWQRVVAGLVPASE